MPGMSDTGIPYADKGWNPAPGCSKKCAGCWARAAAKRSKCVMCKTFFPHMHYNRIGQPSETKKPAVVAVDFMGELFDPKRETACIYDVFRAALNAPQHTYLWLTQQPKRMLQAVGDMRVSGLANWHFGVTARTQTELDLHYPVVKDFPALFWLSLEPLWGSVVLPARLPSLSGVIVGCDRRADIPFDRDWVREIVRQCHIRGIPIYVKQLRVDGKLLTDPHDFPVDLRIRDLAWGDKLRKDKP